MQASSKTKNSAGHRVARLHMAYNHMLYYDQQTSMAHSGPQFGHRPSSQTNVTEVVDKISDDEKDQPEDIQERIIPGAFDIVGRGDFPAINVGSDRIYLIRPSAMGI